MAIIKALINGTKITRLEELHVFILSLKYQLESFDAQIWGKI